MSPDWQSYTASFGVPPNDVFDTDSSGASEHLEYMVQHPETLELLDPSDCLDAYARPIVSGRSNLIIVTNNYSPNSTQPTVVERGFYSMPSTYTSTSNAPSGTAQSPLLKHTSSTSSRQPSRSVALAPTGPHPALLGYLLTSVFVMAVDRQRRLILVADSWHRKCSNRESLYSSK